MVPKYLREERRMPSQSPIKVSPETKEQIRIAAAVLGRSQSEVVGEAVCEYVKSHAQEFQRGLEEAREALAGGDVGLVSFLTGATPEQVKRIRGGR